MRKIYLARSLRDTQKIAQKIKNLFQQGKIPKILLISGELGAGKTTFIRFLIKAYGLKVRVASPTFILWQTLITNDSKLHHLDLYRLENVQELLKLDFQKELKDQKSIFLVEWGEKMLEYLQKRQIKFSHLVIIRLNKRQRFFDLHL